VKNVRTIVGIVMLIIISLTACSSPKDFNAKSYVQSSLDAEYHREYTDYANLMEISEEDVKKQVEEDFNEKAGKAAADKILSHRWNPFVEV